MGRIGGRGFVSTCGARAFGSLPGNGRGPEGWIRLSSVGLRIKVFENGQRLVIEDVKTGERLLTSVEEEAARRAAERRVEQEANVLAYAPRYTSSPQWLQWDHHGEERYENRWPPGA